MGSKSLTTALAEATAIVGEPISMKADVLYRVSVIWRPFGAEDRGERVHHYERGFGKDMTLGEQFDLLQVARDYRDGNLYPGGLATVQQVNVFEHFSVHLLR